MDINKLLNEKLGLDEDSRNLIQEAWNRQLDEAKEKIEDDLREEYASKYEHDKTKITKALDKKINEQLQEEMTELAEDKAKLRKAQVEYKKQIKEHSKTLNRFINRQLVKEIRELRDDRNKLMENAKRADELINSRLDEEMKEFTNDTKALREIKVRQLREHKEKLDHTRATFIKEAATRANKFLNEQMKKEIKQYRNDIIEARNNDFGKRIFEAFASEYLTSYLSENSQMSKMNQELAKIKKFAIQQKKKLDETESRYKANRQLLERERKLGRLLAPLSKDNRAIMTDLLESVSNDKLEESFEKYLPAVLNEKNTNKGSKTLVLREGNKNGSKIKDGNRRKTITENKSSHRDDNLSRELDEIYKLAGTNKGD